MNEKQDLTPKKTDKIMDSYSAWKITPNDETTARMLDTLDFQINSALRSFAPGMEDHMKLRARSIALEAARTYDPKKGMHLKSYVYQQLQPLQREFGKRSNVVSLPERHIMEGRALADAEGRFEEEHGRAPSLAELADYTSIPIKRIKTIREHKYQTTGTSTIDPETGDSMISVEDEESLQKVWADYVYASLDPVDQKIYEWTTGYGGTKIIPKMEIAKRLRISSPAVSQRINKIADQLEEGMNLDR